MAKLVLSCFVLSSAFKFSVDIYDVNTISDSNSSHRIPFNILTIDHLKKMIYCEQQDSFGQINPNMLILWKVSIPTREKNGKYDKLKENPCLEIVKKELEGEKLDEFWNVGTSFSDIRMEHVHIIIQPPPPITTEIPIKKHRIDNWMEYTVKDGLVKLPPILFTMLASKKFRPAPRNEFEKLLKDVQFGQNIILPSLGQKPKNYGENYQGKSLLITEQMIEIWNMLASDRDSSTKRVLSGPMGVGKSYLILFLAAKAYAEGWLLLYVSDANELAKPDDVEIAKEICMRFLALNNDILTKDHFNQLMSLLSRSEENEEKVMQRVASNIMDDLLKQLEEKTLLVIDEHGKLFKSDPPVPLKQVRLNSLIHLNAWNQERKGCRVVLTSTAKFERVYLKIGITNWIIYVTPLSTTIFDKLLSMNNTLSSDITVRNKVTEITNRVPRELMKLSNDLNENLNYLNTTDKIINFLIQFEQDRYLDFFNVAQNYYTHYLDSTQRYSIRHALASMFLPRKEGDIDRDRKGFDHQFVDLGLVYRVNFRGRIQHHPLCPAAKNALLQLYKSIPLPQYKSMSIMNGNMTGIEFEDVLFQQLLRYLDVTFKATDLTGKQRIPLHIKFNYFKILQDPPERITDDNILFRCYEGYPRFDFILGRTFIQMSISNFTTHNTKSANIEKAFTDKTNQKNQIENYLDNAYGGRHKAYIDSSSKKFIVTCNGQTVHDFHIVYICGKLGNPNHTGKVKDFPDILHINLDELKLKLFGNLLME